MPSSMNENPPVPTIPVADENEPGNGRRSTMVETSRSSTPMRIGGVPSGTAGESDDPADNPVRDSNPLRITTG